VLRIRSFGNDGAARVTLLGGSGDGGLGGSDDGFGAPPPPLSAPPPLPPLPRLLPRCTEGSFPGRWLPIHAARPLVANGASIPESRAKYWVPFGCRPTHWDLAALRRVAAAGGDTGANPASGNEDRLVCHLPSLERVVLTGVAHSYVHLRHDETTART
jgi:hypothetical protein